MQTIVYTVALPSINDGVLISNFEDSYVVSSVESEQPPYDSAIITNVQTGDISRIVVTRGKWQVEGLLVPHTISIIPKHVPMPTIRLPMSKPKKDKNK